MLEENRAGGAGGEMRPISFCPCHSQISGKKLNAQTKKEKGMFGKALAPRKGEDYKYTGQQIGGVRSHPWLIAPFLRLG